MTSKRNVVEDRVLCSTRALHHTIRIVLLICLSLGAAAIRSAEAQTGILQGTVSTIDPQGQNQSLPGASLKLTPATPGRTPASAVTNEQGEYKFTDLPAALYTLQVGL